MTQQAAHVLGDPCPKCRGQVSEGTGEHPAPAIAALATIAAANPHLILLVCADPVTGCGWHLFTARPPKTGSYHVVRGNVTETAGAE